MSYWTVALLVLLVSSVIAVALTLQSERNDWIDELIASNAIGFSIFGLIRILSVLSRDRIGLVPVLCIAVPTGILVGGKVASLFGVYDFVGQWLANPLHEWKSIGIAMLFALSASIFVNVSTNAAAARLELETERRRRAEDSRSQAVAELGLLQAQIEPHFLFNTLAHVQSAIDQDPAVGKQVLEHLIRYLRGTLTRSRTARYTLAQERELIESLLSIASIRLGPRLRTHISIPEDLAAASLPPLLLQPLVENAIKHGIEPSIEGGEIRVEGVREGELLILRVVDTGVGMGAAGAEGIGLSNVRARLESLYGDRAGLILEPRVPHGFVAELRLPAEWK
jgi:LytS/YehU family sensor histidine kinase/multisubunit Na+/H+ antiporter MnhF subunit